MRHIWQSMQASRNAWLKAVAALAAFCVIATLALSIKALVAAGQLQGRMDRDFALVSAQQQLLSGLAREQLEETLDSLLRQADYGFRYLAVRGTDGSILAARGRYEGLNRDDRLSPTLRVWLRAKLYTAFGEAGTLSFGEGDRRRGSLEYAMGSPRSQLVRDEAVDRLRTTGWLGGMLALLFAAASLLLLRSALVAPPETPGLQERSRGQEPGRLPPELPAPDPLPAALDALGIGVIDIDHQLRVRLINATAAALTGWSAGDAAGQLVYTVFHARDDSGAPIPSPAERCVREGVEQPAQDLRLRPRGGSAQDAMVEARAVPLSGGARMVFQDASSRIASRDQLRAQARLAEGVVDHLLEAVLTTDNAGVVKSANARALRMFGHSAEDMQRMTVARLLPVPFMNTPGLKLTDYIPGGQSRMPKLAGWRKDATTFPAELVVQPMHAGGEERLVVIIRDISEQLRSQSLAQRLGRLLDSASEEVYIFDAQSLYFTEVNKGARKNLGLKPDQLARMSLTGIATDLESGLLQSYLARLRGGEVEHITYKANHKRSDGSTYPVEVRLSFSRDEEPPVFMAIALDITEREVAEQRMHQLAHYDTLTKLPNRTLLFDRLKQAMHLTLRSGQQLAVLFMDLDGFKPINDAYGHEAGDSVLQALAERLNASFRAADTVARFGGDEFVVLALGIRNAEDAMTIADKVHALFKAPFEIRGQPLTLCASIGVTLYPADPMDAEGLLRHADAAMYAAKQKGRGRSQLFALLDKDPSTDRLGRQRADLAQDIHLGLANNQFRLQLLPVIGASGEVAAGMADFYWLHPEFGRVDARDSLDAARLAGLHAEIEYWLLRELASLQGNALQQGLPCAPVLLPLSARQWHDREFPERLRNVMDAARAPLQWLIVVIDGTVWLDASAAMRRHWPQLLQQGLRIAVRRPDPAGSFDGIALTLLPLQGENAADESKVFAQARHYHERQQLVLIEGITHRGQWDRLRKAGVRYGYGSGLQAALTPLELASWAGSHEVKPL